MSAFTEIQALARDCLTANIDDQPSPFAALPLFVELDKSATAVQLANVEREFQLALDTRGIAVVIGRPMATKATEASQGRFGAGRATLLLHVPVYICENEQINRGDANPAATPPIDPCHADVDALIEQGLAALLAEFRLADTPIPKAPFEEGFWANAFVVTRQHTIAASRLPSS